MAAQTALAHRPHCDSPAVFVGHCKLTGRSGRARACSTHTCSGQLMHTPLQASFASSTAFFLRWEIGRWF
jgi:hypothetical protein